MFFSTILEEKQINGLDCPLNIDLKNFVVIFFKKYKIYSLFWYQIYPNRIIIEKTILFYFFCFFIVSVHRNLLIILKKHPRNVFFFKSLKPYFLCFLLFVLALLSILTPRFWKRDKYLRKWQTNTTLFRSSWVAQLDIVAPTLETGVGRPWHT